MLNYSIVTQPAHGTVSNVEPIVGSALYTPAAGYTGEDSLTYKANDGANDSSPATVHLTISAPALAPVLSGLRLSPGAFAAARSGPTALAAGATATFKKKRKTGTVISYRDSQGAVTTFTVLQSQKGVRKGKRCVKAPKHPKRKQRRCMRFVIWGPSPTDKVGSDRLRFTGRLPKEAKARPVPAARRRAQRRRQYLATGYQGFPDRPLNRHAARPGAPAPTARPVQPH